ncbi:hypothetical protein BDQ17DRAFT_1367245 [Cyathus striatus]|nr:hypothetical protein BDQ17DRAFT_1379739 [Cyathus striatus]KAF8994241.1 hypothetical protein BDQ17DRAFT_1367245 [Cyathus striatus]
MCMLWQSCFLGMHRMRTVCRGGGSDVVFFLCLLLSSCWSWGCSYGMDFSMIVDEVNTQCGWTLGLFSTLI